VIKPSSVLPGRSPRGRVVIVIEKSDLFTDEGDRGFIEATIEGDRSILCYDSQGAFTEEIFEMGWGGRRHSRMRGEKIAPRESGP